MIGVISPGIQGRSGLQGFRSGPIDVIGQRAPIGGDRPSFYCNKGVKTGPVSAAAGIGTRRRRLAPRAARLRETPAHRGVRGHVRPPARGASRHRRQRPARPSLDLVILMVANVPWQKVGHRDITPAEDRLAMVEAAVAEVASWWRATRDRPRRAVLHRRHPRIAGRGVPRRRPLHDRRRRRGGRDPHLGARRRGVSTARAWSSSTDPGDAGRARPSRSTGSGSRCPGSRCRAPTCARVLPTAARSTTWSPNRCST